MANTGSGAPAPNAAPGQIGIEDVESGIADSLAATASVLAPGANGGIVSVPVPAGIYSCYFTVWLNGGAPAATDLNNAYINATNYTTPRIPVIPVINQPITTGPYRITIPAGGGAIGINASGAGTAGVTYIATVIADRVA